MELKAVFAVVFLGLVSVGSGLECYRCTSGESWGMCLKNKYVQKCKAWEDRCYKASVDTYHDDSRVIRYSRGCATDKQCYEETMDDCKGGDKKNYPLPCDVYCCSGDLCNGAAHLLASGVVACAVLITHSVLALLI